MCEKSSGPFWSFMIPSRWTSPAIGLSQSHPKPNEYSRIASVPAVVLQRKAGFRVCLWTNELSLLVGSFYASSIFDLSVEMNARLAGFPENTATKNFWKSSKCKIPKENIFFRSKTAVYFTHLSKLVSYLICQRQQIRPALQRSDTLRSKEQHALMC